MQKPLSPSPPDEAGREPSRSQPDQLFSQQNNEWRGGWVSPYTANIQWDIYQNGQRQLLVKMLYNEKEIAFKTGCQPYQSGSHYYDFEELKRCYGYNG